MNPADLAAPPSPLGFPAPYWFLVLLKVAGFTLHMAPMHLWTAGLLVALLLIRRPDAHARLLGERLITQLPVVIALGINFGIVPLLFLQVAYYRVFYPATVLVAWSWFAVIPLLVLAYYGVYLYAGGLRQTRLGRLHRLAGWVAAAAFLAIGFAFANALTLMTRLDAWPDLWRATSRAGAPLGTALNLSDPRLLPRWLMLLALALVTTAAYAVVDAGLFVRGLPAAYRRWVAGFALRLATLGVVGFALFGSWYAFGTWGAEVRQAMLGRLAPLTAATAAAPALPWLLIARQRRGPTPGAALATGLAQFGVLALNATSRQVVQNVELARFLDVAAEPMRTQWSPLVVFLLLLAGGVGVILWMVGRARSTLRPVPH